MSAPGKAALKVGFVALRQNKPAQSGRSMRLTPWPMSLFIGCAAATWRYSSQREEFHHHGEEAQRTP